MAEHITKHTTNQEEEQDDELGIKKLMKEVTEINKKIDDAFDERIRRLDSKKKLLPDENEEDMHQAKVSSLNEKFKELKARISEARRSGKDPFIADLMLRNVSAKIKMAEITHEQRDFEEVQKILKRAESELEEAIREEELDVKKEIAQRLREEVARQTGKISEDK